MSQASKKSLASKKVPAQGRKGNNPLVQVAASNHQSQNRNASLRLAPVARSSVRKTGKPKIKSNDDGSIVVSHREYLSDVTGNSTFTVNSYSVNPGLITSFPWLSRVARNYESYRFRKLHYIYETQASTATAGSVQMAIDYDAQDDPPVSKIEIMSYHNAVRSPLWTDCRFDSDFKDTNPLSHTRFIRLGGAPTGTDIKTYDIGQFHISTVGGPDSTVGELYVEYEVMFLTPQLNSAAEDNARSLKLVSVSTDKNNPLENATSTGDLDVTLTDGHTLTFNTSGSGLLIVYQTGASLTNNYMTYTGTTATRTGLFFVQAGGAGTNVELHSLEWTAGQILTFVQTGTSVSGTTFRIAPYAVSLGGHYSKRLFGGSRRISEPTDSKDDSDLVLIEKQKALSSTTAAVSSRSWF